MLGPLPVPPPTAPALRASEPTSYDAARHGAAVDWTSKCIVIDGVPRVIVSAEFHYFRVPDRARWRPLLAALRAAGFNAVRLYVHWGYHSPAEGKLDFTGNRDIDHLLRLCTELELFVIPAPGPYICAEVQAGGYPLWLVAKRDLRVRHLLHPPIGLRKRWDQAFHDHCAAYFAAVMRILVPHERTGNRSGCIVALQIENELRQSIAAALGGLDAELRLLAQVARDAGSTVPFFHNDDRPAGSWASDESTRVAKRAFRKVGRPGYRTDLYGFDLYFTFPPGDRSGDMSSVQVGMIEACGVSSCLNVCGIGGAGVGGSDAPMLKCLYNDDAHAPPPALAWAATAQMSSAVDSLEARFAAISGSAASAPPFVAEAQVGWINQWGRLRGYDDIYNFFGDDFSATLLVSLAAQGVTMTNHYMGYGGTNHGSLGDTEVYTSYDYSAFIREFGMLSARGRRMRLSNLFMRSFATRGLAHTALLDGRSGGGRRSVNATQARVKATVPAALLTVREAVLPRDATALGVAPAVSAQPPMFAFLRNLSSCAGRFNLIVDDVVLPCFVAPCEAMTAPLYYPLGPLAAPTAAVFACTVPVVARAVHAGSELWVLRTREGEKGRLVVTLPDSDRSRGVRVEFATLPAAAGGERAGGVLTASDQDQGAAASMLAAPLEELGLNHWQPFGAAASSAPVAVRASTEPAGLCFSLAFAGRRDACVVSLHDASSAAGAAPVLRLVCLSDADASTFTADCSGDDPYVAPRTSRADIQAEVGGARAGAQFSAAWGADELGFLPGGELHAACSARREGRIFLVHGGAAAPPEFEPVSSGVLPGLYEHVVPASTLQTALHASVSADGPGGDPLDPSHELPVDGWERRAIDWSADAEWKSIKYEERDPLDHLLAGGHVAYRLRFRTASKRATVVINIRHVAGVWCNDVSCGSQVVYSHNVASAGAMHAVDLHQAGKQRHDLTPGLAALAPAASGVHEVIILVLSFGQSRSPFLLNDVRNKRGLLSARLSRRARASGVDWAIAGVDGRTLDNAYESTGLPIEALVSDTAVTAGFAPTPSPRIVANDGVVYFRTTFKVPSCSVVGGNVRYPLRLRVDSSRRSVAMLWVNGMQVGRYVQATGPQSDFYVPEGVITECKNNVLVVAAWGPSDGQCSVRVLPWVVDRRTGNLDSGAGEVFALRASQFALRAKGAIAAPAEAAV